MTHHKSPFRLPQRWQWTMWPFIGLAGGGTVVGLAMHWEDIPFAECLPLAALPVLYAAVYGVYHCIFSANVPCRKDLDNSENKRS